MLTYSPPSKFGFEHDDIFNEAIKFIADTGLASATNLQRHFKIGYARAARLLDELQENNIVGKVNGAKPREILIPHKGGLNDNTNVSQPAKVDPKPEPPITWKKTNYADNKPQHFQINLGQDDGLQSINIDLEKYGNLMIFGSQFTGAVDLLNNILAESMAMYSPEELRIIAIDGNGGDLVVPSRVSHLLTPIIVEPEKAISAFMWLKMVIEKRANGTDDKNTKIILIINSLNQFLSFSPSETEDNLYQILTRARKQNIFVITSTDYPNPRTSKNIVANCPAKLVFKPTDKKIAHDIGIPESIKLESSDAAILETMFEGRIKLTINKIDVKKIYDEIFAE